MVLITELQDASPFTISDGGFVDLALTKKLPEEPLCHLLQRAYSDPSTHHNSEDHKGALSALRRLGIKATTTTAEDERSPSLARYLCWTLLDYHNTHPGKAQSPDVQFKLNILQEDQTSCTLDLPSRSRLVLWYLGHKLHISVYIFTNRSKPIALVYPESSVAIGFYQCVDSYLGTNTFHVLEANSRTSVPLPMTTAPEPANASPPAVLRTEQRRITLRLGLKRMSTEESRQLLKRTW
jgi:hypothetical protein